MRRYVMFALLVLTIGALPLLAQGAQGRGRMGGPGMMGFGPMLHQLNLTDAQRQQIHALMQEHQPSGPSRVMEAQRRLHEAILKTDAGSVEALKAELNAAHAEELDEHVAVMQKIAQILTAEQKQQLLEAAPPRRHR